MIPSPPCRDDRVHDDHDDDCLTGHRRCCRRWTSDHLTVPRRTRCRRPRHRQHRHRRRCHRPRFQNPRRRPSPWRPTAVWTYPRCHLACRHQQSHRSQRTGRRQTIHPPRMTAPSCRSSIYRDPDHVRDDAVLDLDRTRCRWTRRHPTHPRRRCRLRQTPRNQTPTNQNLTNQNLTNQTLANRQRRTGRRRRPGLVASARAYGQDRRPLRCRGPVRWWPDRQTPGCRGSGHRGGCRS